MALIVTDVVYEGNGARYTFSDGTIADTTYVVREGVLFLEGLTAEQQIAVDNFNSNADSSIANDARTGGTGDNGSSESEPYLVNNFVDVDASRDVIVGKRYKSYADAVVYILSITTPSYFNRWAVRINGSLTVASPVLNAWIYPMGYSGKTALVAEGNWTNLGSISSSEAYMMFNLNTGGVDPNASTTIQVWDSILNDQEATSGTGTIWLKRTNMFDGDGNANLASCTLIVDDISQATITNGGSIICYGAYYLTVNGTSISFLQTYGAGGQIYFNNSVTIGGGFIYGAEIYGVNFAALALLDVDLDLSSISGSQLKKLITSAQTIPSLAALRTVTINAGSNQMINTIIWDVDIVVSGASTSLETVGCSNGIGTETITEAASGTYTNRGDIYLAGTPGNWSGAAPKDTATAIDRLAAAVFAAHGAIP